MEELVWQIQEEYELDDDVVMGPGDEVPDYLLDSSRERSYEADITHQINQWNAQGFITDFMKEAAQTMRGVFEGEAEWGCVEQMVLDPEGHELRLSFYDDGCWIILTPEDAQTDIAGEGKMTVPLADYWKLMEDATTYDDEPY